jgi:single-stranded-DNA-specific exonuclease
MIVNKKRIVMPTPEIRIKKMNETTYRKAKLAGASNVHAKLIANREIPSYVKISDILNPKLKDLEISKLKDIVKSANRIADAIENKETIGLLCDFDVDGISSAAVLYSSFADFFGYDPLKVKIYISNRMKAGYGFSEEVLDRILNESEIPSLLITADQGSKDDVRITKYVEIMKEKEVVGDVIVTDHHHIQGNGPEDAYAVVNPQQESDEFEDKTICGCTVALFVMVQTREVLIERGILPKESRSLSELLTFSTAATISDCVSMASPINRAIVKKGLRDMNMGTKAPWRVLQNTKNQKGKPIRADSIGFGLGPVINACSRTGGNGLVAVKYYLSDDEKEAQRFYDMLALQNEERKKKEKELVAAAVVQASELYQQGKKGLCIYLENGHHGIHGIASSRICEKFGAPTVIFAPKDYEEYEEEVEVEKKTRKKIDGKTIVESKLVKEKIKKKKIFTVTGSARSIEQVDVHDCLVDIENEHLKNDEKIFLGFGGHSMAAGMSLPLENLPKFKIGFEESVAKQAEGVEIKPIIYVDGEIPPTKSLDLNFVDELLQLEPYGNGFEAPSFKIKAVITSIDIKGPNKDTGIMKIQFGNFEYEAVWFKYDQSVMFNRLKRGDYCEMAVTVTDSFWQGRRKVSLHVQHASVI